MTLRLPPNPPLRGLRLLGAIRRERVTRVLPFTLICRPQAMSKGRVLRGPRRMVVRAGIV